MRKRWIAVAALAFAVPARAQVADLVIDGSFNDPFTAAWVFEGLAASTITWTSQDAAGGNSGSMLFQKNANSSPNSSRVAQCIAVDPGVDYALSGTVFWPTLSDGGYPFLAITWTTGPNCTGSVVNPFVPIFSVASLPRDVWRTFGPHPHTAPDGVHSARLYVGIVVTGSLGSQDIFQARWDDVSFVVPEPGPAAGAAAIAALVALAQRRRRARGIGAAARIAVLVRPRSRID